MSLVACLSVYPWIRVPLLRDPLRRRVHWLTPCPAPSMASPYALRDRLALRWQNQHRRFEHFRKVEVSRGAPHGPGFDLLHWSFKFPTAPAWSQTSSSSLSLFLCPLFVLSFFLPSFLYVFLSLLIVSFFSFFLFSVLSVFLSVFLPFSLSCCLSFFLLFCLLSCCLAVFPSFGLSVFLSHSLFSLPVLNVAVRPPRFLTLAVLLFFVVSVLVLCLCSFCLAFFHESAANIQSSCTNNNVGHNF